MGGIKALSDLLNGSIDPQTLNSSVAKEFLLKLTGMSFEEIKKLPKEISQNHQEIEREWQNVIVNDYQSFLLAHEHLKELTALVVQIPKILDLLSEFAPMIVSKLNESVKLHQDNLNSRQSLMLISNQLEIIEPILEIPFLFDMLIRNNHYEEAMDLQLFTQRLPVRYPDIPFLKRLATIKANSQAMLNQLFSMLRGPAKLPLCIRVIGYLRRLGFSDSSLRVVFLSLRYEYLKGLLAQIKEPKENDYVRRWIEIQREHMFDIISHYKAIFTTTSSATNADLQVLSSFCIDAISTLIQILQGFLANNDDLSLLPSLNTQIMYYGMSLGRIGLDFRGLIVDLFTKSVERVVKSHFIDGFNSFEAKADAKIVRPQIDSEPQELLLVHIPIALSYNHIMNGLNQLRYLPCKTIHSDLSEFLINGINEMNQKIILEYEQEKRNTAIIAWLMHDVYIPAVCNGLDCVLGSNLTDTSKILLQIEAISSCAKPGNLLNNGLISPTSDIQVEDDSGAGIIPHV
jgi:hypothetical protein